MTQDGAWMITNVTGLMIKEFVTRIQQGSHCQVQCFRDPDRHDDFIFRIVLEIEQTPDITGDCPAQFKQTQIIRVTGLTSLERKDRRFPNMPGSHEIGLPDPKTNGIRDFFDNGKEVSNAGCGQIDNVARDVALGVLVHSISQALTGGLSELDISPARIKPCSL